MISPVYYNTHRPDGSIRDIIIEPVLNGSGGRIRDTGSYKLYKTSIDNESALFTEPLEIDEKNDDLEDKNNPDYLGQITLAEEGKWQYEGDLLSSEEQGQVSAYIRKNSADV